MKAQIWAKSVRLEPESINPFRYINFVEHPPYDQPLDKTDKTKTVAGIIPTI